MDLRFKYILVFTRRANVWNEHCLYCTFISRKKKVVNNKNKKKEQHKHRTNSLIYERI